MEWTQPISKQYAWCGSAGSGTHLNLAAAAVRQFPLFSNLSTDTRRRIVASAAAAVFRRRQTIFFQGDPINRVILLTKGSAKTTQLGQNGSEVILRLSGPGDLVGPAGFGCRSSLHRSIARALQAAEALVWDLATFEHLTVRYPVLRHNAGRIFDEQLGELEERFREISTESVPLRVGRQIFRLVNRVGERVDRDVRISLSREELAQMTGTTLFTVSRLLSQWKELGILSPGRELVTVHNVAALENLSGSN